MVRTTPPSDGDDLHNDTGWAWVTARDNLVRGIPCSKEEAENALAAVGGDESRASQWIGDRRTEQARGIPTSVCIKRATPDDPVKGATTASAPPPPYRPKLELEQAQNEMAETITYSECPPSQSMNCYEPRVDDVKPPQQQRITSLIDRFL